MLELKKKKEGLCYSTHRRRSWHVAEKIKVVDILSVEPRNEGERKTKASDTSRKRDLHDHEALNSSPDRVRWLHGWVGAGKWMLLTKAVCAADGKKQLSPRFIIRKWI